LGSGLNYFLNWVDKTPTFSSAGWYDVNVSGDGVPSGASGAILRLVNTTNTDRVLNVRRNGSTGGDITNSKVLAYGHIYCVVKLDANRVFEVYLSVSGLKVYLLGYTDEDVVFKDDEVTLTWSGSAGDWYDKDLSSEVPAGATGVILRVTDSSAADSMKIGFRCNGSTWDLRFRWGYKRHSFIFVGCDANRIIETNYEDSSTDKYYLVGYCKGQVNFKVNPEDISLTAIGAWADKDITSNTAADADGAIIWILYNGTSSTNYKGGVRKNGSTNNDNANMKIKGSEYTDKGAHITGLCGLDADQIFEGYIENAVIDFYLVGYCRPSGAVLKEVTDVLNLSDTLLRNKTLAILDQVGLADTSLKDWSPQIIDVLSLADSILRDKSFSVSDQVTLTDSILRDKTLIITESIGLTDLLYTDKTFTVADSLSLSDTILLAKFFEVLDSIGLSDLVEAIKTFIIVDSIGLTDAISILKTFTVPDTISLSDIVKAACLVEPPQLIFTRDGHIILRISSLTKSKPDYIMLI